MKRTALIGCIGLFLFGCGDAPPEHREVPPGARDAGASKCTAFTARHTIPVLVLSYLPSADGNELDPDETGIDASLDEMQQRVESLTEGTIEALQDASRYRGYADPSAPCSLHYLPVDHVQYVEALPPRNDAHKRPDYMKVLQREDICRLVEKEGVKEVWLWGYHHGNIEPAESNMAGPHGDISNSERVQDMPVCKSTYTLYNYNYGRGVAEAVHDHAHQIENVMLHLDSATFDNWRYPRAGTGVHTSCGDAHFPPNGLEDYDYANPTPVASDCLDWRPAAAGETTEISCRNWGCDGDPQLQYLVWWMQNLPGRDNGLTRLGGASLGNWWDAIADFDAVVEAGFEPEAPATPKGSTAQCDALGYAGACLGDTSVWSEHGTCRVRDCASEGRTCGYISQAIGWGCLGGTQGATTFDCGRVGYTGVCTADDTLVWVEDNACRVVHCPDRAQSCGWDGALGYNCV